MVNTTSSEATASIDAYALFEALTGKKIERSSSSVSNEDWADVPRPEDDNDDNDDKNRDRFGREPKPDQRPSEVNVGCINPYALVEAMLGHRLDRRSTSAAHIISDVLQTDYDELFDMKYDSVLFAGLRYNKQDCKAEMLSEKDTRILQEKDLVTPDLSQIQCLKDLQKLGMKDLGEARVKMCRMQNGKLRLVVSDGNLSRTVNNRDITMTLNDLATRFRRGQDRNDQWTPPNAEWRNIREALSQNIPVERLAQDVNRLNLVGNQGSYSNNYQGNAGTPCSRGINIYNQRRMHSFDDACQGALSNSWLIAAIFSVGWANPAMISRAPRDHRHDRNNMDDEDDSEGRRRHRRRELEVRFHDKGGRNNSKTETMRVDFEVPVNNSSNDPIYCRSSDGADIWPSLYEKAFAKWMTNSHSERPDITQTSHGDPIKCMAQINNREPQYYMCSKHDANDLVGLVRRCSVNFKTINPMCAYTYASGHQYRGANLVANHAYSVLGWTSRGQRQYIILRNPWGVTEPFGLTSYPGLIDSVEADFWRPAYQLDRGGVLAMEANEFKMCFECLGVAK